MELFLAFASSFVVGAVTTGAVIAVVVVGEKFLESLLEFDEVTPAN